MIILGIETTCDETGVGIVKDGCQILSSVVSSSSDFHKKFGGVVPEVAAREQVRLIMPVIDEALRLAQGKLQDADAIAVAFGPGLVGSLLVGVETAKTLAIVLRKPLIAVNHLIGHVYANWLTVNSSPAVAKALAGRQFTEEKTVNCQPKTVNLPQFPIVALIVSGGHTDLILMKSHRQIRWLGGTRDDAAGEAFDKVARVLGLGYPGGPGVERFARQFTVDSSQSTVRFPRPMIGEDNFDFSFSGLKTAVWNLVVKEQLPKTNYPQIADEFQKAIVDVLVAKTLKAAKKFKSESILVGGGVAANLVLCSRLTVNGSLFGIPVFFPPVELCVDNGTMIAAAAFFQKNFVDPLKLSANPSLYFT